MGFILLTFTGTSLTLIFHPLHMSILYRCNRKKKSKSHRPFWDFSHREQGSSRWQASAVQKKFTQEGSLSGSLGQWKRPQSKMEVVSWNLIYKTPLHTYFIRTTNPWLKLWCRKNIYNADANMCSLFILSNFVWYIKNQQILCLSML